jgi:hypothetical protein
MFVSGEPAETAAGLAAGLSCFGAGPAVAVVCASAPA